MNIQLESQETNTIMAYDDSQICVNHVAYSENCLISNQTIISAWNIQSLLAPDDENIKIFLQLEPELILLGHALSNSSRYIQFQSFLSKKRIGVEVMSIGAACRTFNVLLSEGRKVVLGIIFY